VVEYSDRVGDATWQRGRPMIGSYPNIEEVRMRWSGPTARDDAVVAGTQLEPRTGRAEAGGAMDPTQNEVEEGVCDRRWCRQCDPYNK
jgi:hypothetical protein